MATRKKVKDDEGHEYEIEVDDEEDDEDEDEDEDDENIYLTEADLRWLKQMRKQAASDSPPQTGQKSKKKSSGIPVRKRSQKGPTDITSKKNRVRRLTLSA